MTVIECRYLVVGCELAAPCRIYALPNGRAFVVAEIINA
jgi:hypothetical protein